MFVDAIMAKIGGRQVANRPIHAAIGVTLDGERGGILGLWTGQERSPGGTWSPICATAGCASGSSGTCIRSTPQSTPPPPATPSSSSPDNGAPLPSDRKTVDNAWDEFIPFLDQIEIRRVIQHDRHRVAQRPLPAGDQTTRHFPSEQGAPKYLDLVTSSLDPTGEEDNDGLRRL